MVSLSLLVVCFPSLSITSTIYILLILLDCKKPTLVRCPPLPQDFLWAGNGIFRSVTRTEFRAVALYHRVSTPELIELSPQFQLLVSPVPREKVKDIIAEILRYPDLEQLFYLYWRGERWEVFKPEQECTPYSCVCVFRPLSRTSSD
jgi:hypothetical protein